MVSEAHDFDIQKLLGEDKNLPGIQKILRLLWLMITLKVEIWGIEHGQRVQKI